MKKLLSIVCAMAILVILPGILSLNKYVTSLEEQLKQKNEIIAKQEEEINELTQVIETRDKILNGEQLTDDMICIIVSYSEKDTKSNKLKTVNDDVRLKSGLTSSQINSILKGTLLENHGEVFLVAEFVYGINAHFLLSVSAHETNWWKSEFARKRNNLFGWGAYTHNPRLAMYFNDQTHCIMHVAQRLNKLYTSENGKYYKGATVAAIGSIYATDRRWAEGVIRRSRYIEERIGVDGC